MTRDEVIEFHYILDIDNLKSVLRHGILCKRLADKIVPNHSSIADPVVQARRDRVVIPNGGPLHHYANVYFNARNPMMFKIRAQHLQLCVLRIDPRILDYKRGVISDRNASADYARFYDSKAGLAALDSELVFAEYWTSRDPFEYCRRKSAICAELLIPGRIEASHIVGVYVSNELSETRVKAIIGAIPVKVNRHIFFL